MKENSIPSFGYCSKNDGSVYEYLRDCPHSSIGKATSATTKSPNTNFNTYHADLWKEYYGEKDYVPSRIRVKAELIRKCLAIASK